jgi:flagella basal body P-ring formation protein FlgA
MGAGHVAASCASSGTPTPTTSATSSPVPSVTARQTKLIAVLLAAKDIPKGALGDDAIRAGEIKLGVVPDSVRPAGAFPPDIQAVIGQVTTVPLRQGQVLTRQDFTRAPAA